MKKNLKKFGLRPFLSVNILLFFLLLKTPTGIAQSSIPSGISRGEAVELTVRYLNLEEQNQTFLNQCDADLAACTFSFSTRTNFAGISLSPLIYYPDVGLDNQYYHAINTATKLDLVKGYIEEENSPFKPERPITRIEALKLLMGAAKILDWKEKFELKDQIDDRYKTNKALIKLHLRADQWWYRRYLLAAVEKGLYQINETASVDGTVNKAEFLALLEHVYKVSHSRQDQPSVDSSRQATKEATEWGNNEYQIASHD